MGELLARIDSRELTAWEAYERVAGPVGPERGDRLVALLASVIVNVNRGKRSRAVKPEDFLPNWDPGAPRTPAAEQSPQDQLRLVQSINRSMGGRVRTRGGDDGDAARPTDQNRRRPLWRRRGRQEGQGDG